MQFTTAKLAQQRFSKLKRTLLFFTSELLADAAAIIRNRRWHTTDSKSPWANHTLQCLAQGTKHTSRRRSVTSILLSVLQNPLVHARCAHKNLRNR